MFNEVLAGVDFGPGGRDAIALASRLLDGEGKLTLAHVFPGQLLPSHAVTPGLTREDRERAEGRLAEERAEAHVAAELVVAQGSPGHALHELAEDRGADLLVLGSCHRGVLGRAMLGDDTRASIDGAPCAVAIAPAGYAGHPAPIVSIGVGYDGSPESELALATARALAASLDAEIRALEVVSLSGSHYALGGALLVSEMNQRVAQADARIKGLAGVEGRAEYGFPAEDLAIFGQEVDLLIVGSRGFGPWGRLVHGSTSAGLARHTHGPLLIVPRPIQPPAGDEETGATSVAVTA